MIDNETHIESECSAETVAGSELAALLDIFSKTLSNAPENKRYDVELTIEETTVEGER